MPCPLTSIWFVIEPNLIAYYHLKPARVFSSCFVLSPRSHAPYEYLLGGYTSQNCSQSSNINFGVLRLWARKYDNSCRQRKYQSILLIHPSSVQSHTCTTSSGSLLLYVKLVHSRVSSPKTKSLPRATSYPCLIFL